ncbi:hypothetical protein DESC_540004 [Desulfosarcina cetonica]|nr:hypothetical protein DESC_540004 [Desulfosarcina cetonica]
MRDVIACDFEEFGHYIKNICELLLKPVGA